jgi:arylsulfatase A-like enzyme
MPGTHETLSRRHFLAGCAAGLAAPWLGARAEDPAEPAAPPNIVLFLVDDMGWQDTSVPFWTEPTRFNAHFRTPHMERLARLGTRFTQAYAHPVCSPTRTSILTGWNPARHKVTNWTLHPDQDTSRGWSPRDWNLRGLQPDAVTLPRLLRQAGYFTIHCGKAHWGARGTPGEDPRALGFDINIAGHAAGAPGSYQGERNFGRPGPDAESSPWAVPGLEAYHGQRIDLSEALTLEALGALDQAQASGKPFFLYMAHYAVHTPIEAHHRHIGHYEGRDYAGTTQPIPPVEARYASMVEGMDASLGALLDKIEALGEAQNTLVVFTSDNGGLSAHQREATPYGTGLNTHNWPLRAGKGSAYEGGTRVPFLAAWAKPDAAHPLQRALPIAGGGVSTTPLISEDLFPTLLQVGGAFRHLPADYPLDGRDLGPAWRSGPPDGDRALVFHYPHTWGPKGPGYEPHSAMRLGEWKVIHFYAGSRWELYHLASDIGETRDRAADDPARLARMAKRLRDELRARGAQWPVDPERGETVPMRLPGAPG